MYKDTVFPLHTFSFQYLQITRGRKFICHEIFIQNHLSACQMFKLILEYILIVQVSISLKQQ